MKLRMWNTILSKKISILNWNMIWNYINYMTEGTETALRVRNEKKKKIAEQIKSLNRLDQLCGDNIHSMQLRSLAYLVSLTRSRFYFFKYAPMNRTDWVENICSGCLVVTRSIQKRKEEKKRQPKVELSSWKYQFKRRSHRKSNFGLTNRKSESTLISTKPPFFSGHTMRHRIHCKHTCEHFLVIFLKSQQPHNAVL